jgi:hypothetical protein
MECLRYKRVLHPTHPPKLVIENFYLFGSIDEGLRAMKEFSGEKIFDMVTGILKTISQAELKVSLKVGCIDVAGSELRTMSIVMNC